MSAPSSDIVPIRLSLPSGDLVTLWAPRWRENGEEWEAFLGDDEALFAFPDSASLAAFVRTAGEHDLTDHPAWPIVPQLSVGELVPEDTQCYDLVGAPGLVADDPDTLTVSELAEIVRMVRSLADACELDAVTAVLDSAPGFGVLDRGSMVFSGRGGRRLWRGLADTVAERWDDVLDALDALVRSPEVDAGALAAARRERTDPGAEDTDGEGTEAVPGGGAPENSGTAFWDRVGIDPIQISTAQGDHYTLRCYLDDEPVFLGRRGRIDVLPSPRALARHLAGDGADGHDLTRASTWPEVVTAAESGALTVDVDPENTYLLTGLGDDLADGPMAVDPHQLDLGVELLLDVGEWAGDDGARLALASSQSLGWLTSFVLNPDPTRLTPSPPFDTEAGRWNALVDELAARLHRP